MSALTTFAGDLKRSFLDLATIIGVILAFQVLVLRSVPADWPGLLLGLVIVGVGIALFMRGLEIGLFPLGEELAHHLARSNTRLWLLLFAFIIGFATTIAEPALIAIADKAAAVSSGSVASLDLRIVTAFSVGIAIVLGVLRLLWNHPLHWYIIGSYAIVLAITPFAPHNIIGVAYDMGGVTTSTVTVPLIAALGIGLATSLKNRNPVIDGFGLIAFASVTPMIFVQLYGIAVAHGWYVPHTETLTSVLQFTSAQLAAVGAIPTLDNALSGLWSSLLSILPVFITIVFFYRVILRRKIASLKERLLGFGLVTVGLYAFVMGLEIGLFPLGESLTVALATTASIGMVYLYAFAIGFATTVAEPSLTSIAQKAEEISGGAINAFYLRVAVAVGVGIGILLGAYRIVNGDPLALYIMLGYLVVVVLTFFSPRTIIPIAYDSGGVTTSTVTVPIIAALGLGLASAIPGRDPLADGFGLIALASLFPMLTVLSYGIGQQQTIRRHERYIAGLERAALSNVRDPHTAEHHARESKIRKHIITITGTPGSGTTTVSKRVAELLNYRFFSSGDVFRRIASERGITIDQLNRSAEKEGHIDHEIDLIIRILGEEADRIVINSRLGYHWIHGSFKVYLTVPTDVAAERTYKQIKEEGRVAESARSVADEVRIIERRMELERERYLDLYGIDTSNTKPFNLVIDTNERTADDVAHEILAAYAAWSGNTIKKKA